MTEAVIVATARSPIGRAAKGSLVDLRPDDMSAQIVKALMAKVPQVPASAVEDLIMGCGQPAGEAGFNVARVVSILAGLDTPGRHRQPLLLVEPADDPHGGARDQGRRRRLLHRRRCREPSAATAPARPTPRPIRSSSRPASAPRERAQGGASVWSPPEGLPDIYIAMGQTAENVVQSEGLTRQEMDEFAALSQQRAVANVENGFWERRDLTAHAARRHGRDQGRRAAAGTTVEGLSQLKPVFRPDGQVTAGNACPLNDGAAAVLVMSDTKAKELGLTPLARIVSSGVSSLNPEIMGLGPIEASRQALKRAGMTIDDIDLVEINEAFAAQVIPSAKHLGISWDKLNVNGGSIALGHPFGMTGARIMTTLIHGLQEADKQYGLETMCVGGGQGMAMIIERLS